MARKVRIREINPIGTMESMILGKRAYLGLSLGNPAWSSDYLDPLLRWTSQRFPSTVILVGDYLDRHNRIRERGETEEEAAANALAAGAKLRSFLASATADYDDGAFVVTGSREYLSDPGFRSLEEKLDQAFADSVAFRATVLEDVDGFLSRSGRSASKEAVRRSCRYVLEELAIFSMLVEQGACVHLYPGTNSRTLKALSNGTLRSPVPGLDRHICVDLAFK